MIEALYCHVPFCDSICPFCAFAVHGNRQALHGPFLDAIRAEIAAVAADHADAAAPIRAVYLGGGTPSTLSLAEVGDLLGTLRTHFRFADDCEIAFELNPEHVGPAYLNGLRELGVNRASLGLQSLDDATLRALGRHNDAAQGLQALKTLRGHGPANFNADLMFGAPGCPPAAFQADVRALIAAGVPHLSLYGLDLEPGTPFHRRSAVRQWAETQRDAQTELYRWACELLTAHGYRHYEVSNFCLPGREGLQNLLVWDGAEYLGFGPGAHSHRGGRRWHNERHLRAYLGRIAAGERPTAEAETLTPSQAADEALMLALRRDIGLDVAAWERRFGVLWDERRKALAERLCVEGRARLADGRLVLTPAGMMLADEITAALATD